MPRVNGPGTVLILQLHIVALAEVLLAGDRQLKPPEPRLLFQRRRLRAEQLCFAQPVGLADEARGRPVVDALRGVVLLDCSRIQNRDMRLLMLMASA